MIRGVRHRNTPTTPQSAKKTIVMMNPYLRVASVIPNTLRMV
jgi:Ca2+/H+ antiporter